MMQLISHIRRKKMRDKDKVRKILNYPSGEGPGPPTTLKGPAAALQQTIPLKPLEPLELPPEVQESDTKE
jgi:hypothetical protein